MSSYDSLAFESSTKQMKTRTDTPTLRALAFLLFVAIGAVVYLNSGYGDMVQSAVDADMVSPANNKGAVDFDGQLVTTANTVVCPASILDIKRGVTGLQAAIKAATDSTSKREAAVSQAGCEQLQAGVPMFVTREYREIGSHYQARHQCGFLLTVIDTLVYSCSLRNADITAAAPLLHLTQQNTLRIAATQLDAVAARPQLIQIAGTPRRSNR